MNIPLLIAIRDAGGAFLSADSLPGSVAEIDELIAFGFGIERHPYLGAAYRGPAAALCPDQIEWGLEARQVGRRIAVWDRVGSTNDLASLASSSAANHGLVLLAEEQTAGRGRRGRSWLAPRGSSILMSALIFPPPALDDPAWLTAVGALAVAEVVEAFTGLDARIKWPNDVRVRGRKVAGILVERKRGSILGIGLNVNATADDFPDELRESAASLRVLTGEALDRSAMARDLIQRLDRLYVEGIERGPGALMPAWQRRLEAIGRPVIVESADRSIRGRLIEADLVSGLRIERLDGSIEHWNAAGINAVRVVDDSDASPGGGSPDQIMRDVDRFPLGIGRASLIDSTSGSKASKSASKRPR